MYPRTHAARSTLGGTIVGTLVGADIAKPDPMNKQWKQTPRGNNVQQGYKVLPDIYDPMFVV